MSDKKVKLDSIISGEGIVVRWPKKKEEKLAVLDYLITMFEPRVEYKEMQVNMILKKWHSFEIVRIVRVIEEGNIAYCQSYLIF